MALPENRIPEDKLPQCWSDDIRMNALFAPFRLRTANPESWEMKMKFWSDMLRQWCRHKRDPILSAADAKFAFQRKGRTPVCIDIVVEEMIRNGEMCALSKYRQILHNGPEGWMRWGARLAFKPAALALTAVSSLLPARQTVDSDGLPKASIDPTQRFVLESAVQEQAIAFLEKYPAGIERLGTIEELMRITAWQGARETFEVILGYLVSQGMAVKKGDVVKLAEPSKKVSSVTESDEALVKLLSTETRLENDATRLSRDIVATEADAKAALQLGNRLAAKNHLRKKHKLQQRAEQIHSTLENVQHLLHQLRQADTNTVVLDTYKTSSEAMKRGMRDEGLSEDAVLDTLDELKEVIQNYNDVEKALAGSTDDLDAEELEQELRELLAGPGGAPPSGGTPAKDDKKNREEVPNLPTPPKGKPQSKSPEFVFDGELRMIEELNKLSVEDSSPRDKGRRIEKPVAVGVDVREPQTTKQSQMWYPPSSKCLHPTTTWDNNNGYGELRQDDRIHPGQPLNIDFTNPPKLYSDEFAVKDHKLSSGVWLYNADNNNLRQSQFDSPDNSSVQSRDRPFQMAPGGERKQTQQSWPTDEEPSTEDLEKRLRNLRGFDL